MVAGIRTPQKVAVMGEELPEAYTQFMDICAILEKHYHNMQDVEFTIERGKLWMLQTRNGKRTAASAIKIAVDMANEGLITKREAVMRVTPDNVNSLLHPQFDPAAKKAAAKEGKLLAQGRQRVAGRGRRPGVLRRRPGRGKGQGRAGHHGPPLHQAG